MLPYTPLADTDTLSFEISVTNTPNADFVDVIASDTVTLFTAGTIVSGTLTVSFAVFVPITVFPLLVVTVTSAVVDVPEIALIQSFGIVNAVPDVMS